MELAQQQTRARSALALMPVLSRRLRSTRCTPRPPLHPSFRPKTSAPNVHRQRTSRTPSPRPNARILTQTRFTSSRTTLESTTQVRAIVNLATISHHEHLTRTYRNSHTSRSDRAIHHLESTESTFPQGLHSHEPPD